MFTPVATVEDPLAAALAAMTRVLEAVKTDVGAPFEPEALAALMLIRQQDLAEYQRIRAALKKANPSMLLMDLDESRRVRKHPQCTDAPWLRQRSS